MPKLHEKTYYPLYTVLSQKYLFLLWFSNDIDGVVVENNKIVTFASLHEISDYAKSKQINLMTSDFILHNFDNITLWLEDYENKDINCVEILNIWNLLTDIAQTLKIEFIGNHKDKVTSKIYDKLFFGNNLPAITPNGKFYIPTWTKLERKKLAEILTEAICICKNYTHI
jgi:hypothetical protein